MDDRRQAADAIKDLMVREKKSRLPLIIGVVIVLAVGGGAAWWFMQDPAQRPDPGMLAGRAKGFLSHLLNAPIMSAPVTPATSSGTVTSPGARPEDTGLLAH